MTGVTRARLHVILRLDPGADVGRVARMWFEQAWIRLGGALRDQIAVHPLPADDIRGPLRAGRIRDVLPPVGMPWCSLLNYGGDYGTDLVAAHAMNPRSWSWFLSEIEGDGYSTAHLDGGFIENEAVGYMGAGPAWPNLQIRHELAGPIIEQAWLGLSASPDFLAGTAAQEAAVCSLLYDVAADSDPTYGEISLQDAGHMPSHSLLERSLRGLEYAAKHRNWRVHPRDQLKGYSWVTIVPGDLVERLGGIDVLRAAGAFHTVRALPAGGAWLQATERLADYDREAVRKVFDALRPVLIGGRPSGVSVPDLLIDEAP